MTRKTALRRSFGWLVAGLVPMVIGVVLDLTGHKGWGSLLACITVICCLPSCWHSGWRRGHVAPRSRE
jgi:cyanate permease